jgi:nicotinamidase-related amidase
MHISKDSALIVVDFQNDFCPPVRELIIIAALLWLIANSTEA